MNIFEIISGVVLILTCLLIVVVVLKQESKGRGLSGAIMGGANMNEDMRGRMTNNAKWAMVTRYAAIVLFVLTILTCVLSARLK